MTGMIDTVSVESRTTSLNAYLNQSPIGFFIANDNGTIEYINREVARIIGIENISRMQGQSLKEIDSIIRCGLVDAMELVLGGSEFRKDEHICTNSHGQLIILNISCSPFCDENGCVTGIFGTIQDVTATSMKKTEMEQSAYLFSVISQVSEAISSTADLEEVLKIILTGVTAGQGLGFNRAFLFLINEEKNSLEGKIAIGPVAPEEAGEIWSHLAGRHKTLLEFLNDFSNLEGNTPHTLSSVIDGWQIPLGNLSVFSQALNMGKGINIKGQKNLSEESRGILNRLRTNNLAIAPIISKGKNLGLIAADNQITGREISDSLVGFLQTFANHSAIAIERSRMYDSIVERAVELEEKNRQLAESQEQIIRAEKMSVIGELTSSIAHELRNPLTVVGGFANLMLSTGDAGDNTEYLNIIVKETQRAESVLHQVLDFSRVSRTKSREIDYNRLVIKASERLKTNIRINQQKPRLILTDEKLTVWGNPDQFELALYQFMRLMLEEMTDDCAIEITTAREDKKVKLTIGMNGSEQIRTKAAKTLSQIFGNQNGTQKLSIIVAGETIKYHGGNYGLEGSQANFPLLYIELPYYEGRQ